MRGVSAGFGEVSARSAAAQQATAKADVAPARFVNDDICGMNVGASRRVFG